MTNLYAKQQPAEADKTVTLAIRMPLALREAWKAHCDSHNIEMSEVMRRFITQEISKQGVSDSQEIVP